MVRGPKRRRSLRLRDYDYSQPGAYFVTICTKDHLHQFGEIRGNDIKLNERGSIVEKIWKEIPEHFTNIKLDEFIVMPNHVHGILLLDDTPNCRGTACRAPTVEGFGKPVKGSLPTILRSFKSASTHQINRLDERKGISIWQRNYYEHIIRNQESLKRIRRYIQENPTKWYIDPENLNRANPG